MNSFLLPFLLTIAMAVPLLWYHLDGTDPLDIAVRTPSQEEINFAETRDIMRGLDGDLYGPSTQEPAESGGFIVTIDAQEPGY